MYSLFLRCIADSKISNNLQQIIKVVFENKLVLN